MTTRRVTSTDGTTLAVYESGKPAAPTVVAVHGYPDNHAVWDGVVALLSDEFHVVTYDVRGAGASDKPTTRSAYRMAQLVDDLAAVLAAVSRSSGVRQRIILQQLLRDRTQAVRWDEVPRQQRP